MTLDEAIETEENIAEENQRVVDTGIVFDDVTIDMLYCDDTEVIEEHLANYQRCAEEHQQLAEWLKDYKRLLEQEPYEDEINYFNTIYNLSQTLGVSYYFLDEQIEKLKATAMALKALPKELCTDAISRQAVLEIAKSSKSNWIDNSVLFKRVNELPSVTPVEKVGQWVLTQRGKYIDINCSECGYTRIKEYAYNYTVDEIDMQEIKDMVVTDKLNYCECCGVKIQEVK